jgi:hypothetical protein
MGLFKNLFGGKKQPPTEKKTAAQETALAVPDGSARVKVFTYDGRPLGKMSAGTQTELALYGGKTYRMASVYTSMATDDNAVLAYKGKLVGFLGSGADARALRAALRRHGTLLLHATVTGWASGGWPEIVVHFDREWLENYSRQ